MINFNQMIFVATFIDTCDGTFLAVGNSRLPDSSLNASSSYGANTGPERGRLNTTEGDYTGAWASATLGLQHWIQVKSSSR